MRRITFAQMRASLGRLVAVGIAIALGTAFIAATFITTATIERTALDAASAGVGDPDLIVSSYDLTPERLAAIEALPGVGAVQPLGNTWRDVDVSGSASAVSFAPVAPDARLGQVTLLEGDAPVGLDQVALPQAVAERLGVGIGDVVSIPAGFTEVADDAEGASAPPAREVTVSGLTANGSGLGFGTPLGLASRALVDEWATADGYSPWQGAGVLLAPGANSQEVQDALVAAAGDTAAVLTGEQYAQDMAAQFTGGVSVFRGMILAFAGVALAVAGIVIANTFTVLVAQRTRTLALLRCVGATPKQVRRSVRLEALVLGVVASVVGIVAGIALGQAVLSILRAINDGVPLPAVVPVDLWTILVPLVAGVVVTVISASGAARLATKVSPLAALHPVDAPATTGGSGRVSARVVVGWIFIVGGTSAMAAALVWSRSDPDGAYQPALLIGVAGGIVTLIGVVLAAITIVPGTIRALGAALGRVTGPAQRLAATNSGRNPRRTTSTATALIVGVSLVVMMATGAATAQAQLVRLLDNQLAVDVMVTSQPGAPLSADAIAGIRATDGVAETLVLDGAYAQVAAPGREFVGVQLWEVADPAQVGEVVRTFDGWSRDVGAYADGWVVDTDTTLRVLRPDGTEFPVASALVPGLPDFTVLVDAATWDGSELEADSSAVWVALADGADPVAVSQAIEDVLTETTPAGAPAAQVSGGAVERAGFTQIIDTLLIVVIGLLGVAVVIALIGVANTLALSVVERRRENALLRALGLTRRQLRVSLATEGVLLALVGAVIGIVLGLAFGWVGSTLLLGVTGESVPLVVPWDAIAAVVVVAVASGALASVLPARGAAQVPPVVALAG